MSLEDNGLYSTWAREFCIALDGVQECIGQDAIDVLYGTFKRWPSQKDFHEMTDADIARIRDCANEWFETDVIEVARIQKAVEMTRWHWPLNHS